MSFLQASIRREGLSGEDVTLKLGQQDSRGMGVGSDLAMMLSSGAAVAIASGFKVWLAQHNKAHIKIVKKTDDSNLAVEAEGTSKDMTRLGEIFHDDK
jgi:hypothetical protein